MVAELGLEEDGLAFVWAVHVRPLGGRHGPDVHVAAVVGQHLLERADQRVAPHLQRHVPRLEHEPVNERLERRVAHRHRQRAGAGPAALPRARAHVQPLHVRLALRVPAEVAPAAAHGAGLTGQRQVRARRVRFHELGRHPPRQLDWHSSRRRRSLCSWIW